jgi:hypothetical protein
MLFLSKKGFSVQSGVVLRSGEKPAALWKKLLFVSAEKAETRL